MSTVVFYLLIGLTAAKTYPELRTRPPYEWAGELASIIVSTMVGVIGGGALYIIGL